MFANWGQLSIFCLMLVFCLTSCGKKSASPNSSFSLEVDLPSRTVVFRDVTGDGIYKYRILLNGSSSLWSDGSPNDISLNGTQIEPCHYTFVSGSSSDGWESHLIYHEVPYTTLEDLEQQVRGLVQPVLIALGMPNDVMTYDMTGFRSSEWDIGEGVIHPDDQMYSVGYRVIHNTMDSPPSLRILVGYTGAGGEQTWDCDVQIDQEPDQ